MGKYILIPENLLEKRVPQCSCMETDLFRQHQEFENGASWE